MSYAKIRFFRYFGNTLMALGCIGAMAGMFLPVFASARVHARISSTKSNFKSIGLALTMYVQDHDERLPPLGSIAQLDRALSKYPLEDRRWVTMSTGAPLAVNPSLSNRSFAEMDDPETLIVVYDPARGPDERQYAIDATGKVHEFHEDEWLNARRVSGITAPDLPSARRLSDEKTAWNLVCVAGIVLVPIGLMLRLRV